MLPKHNQIESCSIDHVDGIQRGTKSGTYYQRMTTSLKAAAQQTKRTSCTRARPVHAHANCCQNVQLQQNGHVPMGCQLSFGKTQSMAPVPSSTILWSKRTCRQHSSCTNTGSCQSQFLQRTSATRNPLLSALSGPRLSILCSRTAT